MSCAHPIKKIIGIIWLGVLFSLGVVSFIAFDMNRTVKAESEIAFNKNLRFLAESSAKSIQLFFDGVISEIVLLTPIEVVKQYKTDEADAAFRGVISKHDEQISHMILLDGAGDVKLMVTKDPDPFQMKDQINAFFKETMAGWQVNISKKLFESSTYRGIAIGMPIFRKDRFSDEGNGSAKPSGIYASGMIIALVGVDDLINRFINPVRIEQSGFAWLADEEGDILASKSRMETFTKDIYGDAPDRDKKFKDTFGAVIAGKSVKDWSNFDGAKNNFKVDGVNGKEWFVATADINISEQSWTLAVAAPRSEVTRLLNKSFWQLVILFMVVLAILITGGYLITRTNMRWAQAEEKARHAVELEAKNRSLEELNQRIDEFVAVVSHDIRSPLNVISGFVKLIQKSPGGEAFLRETSTMLRSCNRLMQLVNDILDVSKLEAGKVRLAYDPIVIDDLIEESVRTMEIAANEKQQEIGLDLGDKTKMEGDVSKLLQVLNNLLGNAIKFSPKGGKINVSKREKNGSVVIMVSDTGPGIPVDQQGLVFEKFEQARRKQQGIEPGSGLGLTICKNIVELHGGSIGVDSDPGRGSTFHIKLPLRHPNNKQ